MWRLAISVIAAVVVGAGSARAQVTRGFETWQQELRAARPATTPPSQTMPDDITREPHRAPAVVRESRSQDDASPGGPQFTWRGYVGVEGRIFNDSPAIPVQARHGLALVAQPEFSYASEDRRHRISANLFGRVSVEPGFSTADARELFWEYRQDRWSLLAGMNRVFWGATESRHAIDIVNQSDMRENYIGDVKMGQLMAAASLQRGWGQVEFYALPFFRPRAFPPTDDRPRILVPMADAEVLDRPPLDLAARVSISRADVDVHAFYFRGVNREPNLIPVFDGSGALTALTPTYRPIDQVGADVQYPRGPWLIKGELMHRHTPDAHFQAAVGGFEYGLTRLFGSASDLTVLSEYQFDNRPDTEWPAPATRGIYAGLRLAINDTGSSEARAGVVHDLSSDSWLIKVDFTRRLTDQWGLTFAYSGFSHVDKSPALRDYYRDSYSTITLRRYL
jgi:hypothetical protein